MKVPRDVVGLLRELVRIPSVNPHGDPGTDRTGEGECATYVADFLRECGAEVELQEVKPERPNVIGKFPADRGGKKRIVLAPHTDTVSVRGMTIDPFGAELRDGRIWGRGASDTKGTMAAMLWALRELGGRVRSLEHEIWFVGLMSEEAGQDGSKAFVEAFKADFALIGEPTRLDIVNTHKGSIWFELTTRGRAVHSSTPECGENAIYKMIDVVRVIRDEIAADLSAVHDPVLGAPTISTGTITGGSKTNIVPDFCRVEVDVRTVPVQFGGNPVAAISEKLRGACADLEIDVSQAPPLYTDPAQPCVKMLERAGGRCVGAPWFCDAAVFAAAGIPAVAAGPGSIEQAHTRDEWIAVEDLCEGVEFYRRFLEMC